MKTTVVAHPIQGLVKYHGLRRPKLRIPFHDSISVCVRGLTTTTTVEASENLRKTNITINRKKLIAKDEDRARIILNRLKVKAGFAGYFRVVSENNVKIGKGLGFSASGFAALGLAASEALGLKMDPISLSETVRLGAGSATRSLAGGFAVWYAENLGRSYAERLSAPENMDFSMIIVPISSDVRTDEAHSEVLSSPLFKARLKTVGNLLSEMREAIAEGDSATIGRLAEEDTLNLHAITMTGKSRMVLWEPDTVRIIKEVIRMREEGIAAWFSMDTGPSVFINTYRKHSWEIAKRLREMGFTDTLTSEVGGEPFLTDKHLF